MFNFLIIFFYAFYLFLNVIPVFFLKKAVMLGTVSKDDMCKLLFSECFLDIRCSSRALAPCLSYLILFLQNLHEALAPSEAGISHSLYATSFNQFGLKETRLFVVSALSYFVSTLLKHVLNCFQ